MQDTTEGCRTGGCRAVQELILTVSPESISLAVATLED